MTRTQKHWLRFFAYTAVIILVNIAASTIFFRLDLTGNRIHSLSEASRKAVSGLEEPLTIKAYFSANLPSPYNNLEQEVTDLLEEYRIKGNKFFNYSVHNIEGDSASESEKSRGNRTDAQSYGIYPIQIQKIESSEINLVNAFMGIVFIQGDLIETIPVLSPSRNLEYQVTGMIKKMADKTGALLALKEDVRVRLYFSPVLYEAGAEMRSYPDAIAAAVEELNRQNYGRLAFELVDPDHPAPGTPGPEEYRLPSLSVQIGRPARTTQVYASLAVESAGRYATVSLLQRGFFGYQTEDPAVVKESLAGVVDRLTGTNPKIGYLASHGCPPFYGADYGYAQSGAPEMNSFRSLAGARYDFVQVDLRSGGIPEDIQSLLVVAPVESFTEWETYQLDQFVMKGNSLLLFLDSHTEIMPQGEMAYYQQPFYMIRELGLDEMLWHYGFSLSPSYVLDEQCYVQYQQQRDGSVAEIPLYFAPMANAREINQKSPILWNIKGLIFLNASPLLVNQTPASGQTPEILISSSPTSWEMTENINLYNPMMITPPLSDHRKSQTLAAIAQGPMTGFYANRPIPSPPEAPGDPGGLEDQGQEQNRDQDQDRDQQAPETNPASFLSGARLESGETIKESAAGRIFLAGTSFLVMDNLVDSQGSAPNATFIQNLVDCANHNQDFAMMRSKGQSYNPLRETGPGTKRFIQIFSIAGLPILVFLFAGLFWLQWAARKKRIESLFKDEEK